MIDVINNMANFFKETKNVLSSKLVVQLSIILSIINSCNNLQKLLVGEIFRKTIASHLHYHKQTDALQGYVLVLYELGCFIGSLMSGKLIDLYKRHKLTLELCLILGLLSASSSAVAQRLTNVPGVYVSNTLLGFSICACYVPIFDMLFQHTYPKSPSFVILIFVGVCKFASVVFGEACRLLLNYLSGIVVFVFMCSFLLLAILIGVFLQPTYQRLAASNLENASEETVSILDSDDSSKQ